MAQLQDDANTNIIQQPVNEGVLVVDEDIVVNEEQQENQTPQPAFAITMSALALWDYAQTIVQDHQEHAQLISLQRVLTTRLCILTLMVEEKRDELKRLWEELDELELLLGLEHV
ncbi:hypothetical protein C8R48DRAFT_672280 [Suillus tomentosus]|nr:hypothetical protein C8R48DRAFT_672280 [Suillus tomentosus]